MESYIRKGGGEAAAQSSQGSVHELETVGRQAEGLISSD